MVVQSWEKLGQHGRKHWAECAHQNVLSGDLTGGQWLRLHCPMKGVRVQFLAGKLRSHMPLGQKAKMQNWSNTATNPIQTFLKKRMFWVVFMTSHCSLARSTHLPHAPEVYDLPHALEVYYPGEGVSLQERGFSSPLELEAFGCCWSTRHSSKRNL